jgi:mono/diheme cytochrome c family protein
MKRIAVILLFVAIAVIAVINVLNLFDNWMPFGRMWETQAIRAHEEPIPVMDAGSVPLTDAEVFYRATDPETLQPPFDINDAQAIDQGRQGYVYYCIHCHGPNYDGYGTVGQSFSPTPEDLRSERIQTQPVGVLFHTISYGVPDGRQPPLASTIAALERWQIIAFIKSSDVVGD